MRKLLSGFAFLLAAASLAAQAQAPARPQTPDPAALPARDAHQDLLIAVSPDITAESSRAKFGKKSPYDAGILGLLVYFKNDNDTPIRINLSTVRLLISEPGDTRQKLEPLSPEEVADIVLMTPAKDVTSQRPTRRLPGTGLKTNRGKDWMELDSLLRSAAVASDVLAPHSTTHGYYFFDIDHHFDWLSNARLDVPDLSFMLNNKALFFFQIDLALAAPATAR